MTMIMTGVASTGGNVASLNRLARWSALTMRLNAPLAPIGMVFITIFHALGVGERRGCAPQRDASRSCITLRWFREHKAHRVASDAVVAADSGQRPCAAPAKQSRCRQRRAVFNPGGATPWVFRSSQGPI